MALGVGLAVPGGRFELVADLELVGVTVEAGVVGATLAGAVAEAVAVAVVPGAPLAADGGLTHQ